MEEGLRPWVTGIGTQSFEGETFVHAPDAATTLVVCTASEGAFVVGPRDRARYTAGREARRTVVRLTPGRAQAVLDVPVDELVERQLRTVFTKAVGLSPKQFTRVDRVRRVVARGGRGEWARVAAELGYYDQAHLTREFRATMGVPPGAYLARNLPAATYC